MANFLTSLLIKLGIDAGEMKSGLSVAEKDLQKATKRIEKIGNNMVGTGQKLSTAITLPIFALGAAATAGAIEQSKAVAQVEAAITSMGNAAGRSAEQLAKNADALEMNSLVDADVILTKVTANLLTFGNVAGEVFDRAQQSAIDMAQRMGSDPQAAAVMLGKALNDPIKGITALTRVGVQFTEAQKEQIKAFMKTGEVAKAQGIILSEVERQFAGAAKAAADTTPWRQAMVAINQAGDAFGEAILPIIPPITDAIVSVAQAFANLSPTMQNVILVAAGVAAAFGPILIVVGQLTVALASQLAPAVLALQGRLSALAAVEITAAGASTALATALRALMIATGIGAAITVLAGAVYLYTTRTREAVPASQAYGRALATAQQTAKDAKVASENLAKAMGAEREAALKAASAQRALAEQRLKAAQARLLQAEFDAKSTAAEAKRTAALASGGGPGEGVQGRISSSQERFNKARRAAGQAQADAKAAEAAVITLTEAKGDLDRAIANATAPIKLPTIDVGGVNAGTKALAGATKAVGSIGKEAQSAKEKADDLQNVLDRLFPEVAAAREYEEQLKLIQESKLTEQARAAAVRALRREYAGLHRDLLAVAPGEQAPGIEVADGVKTIEDISKEVADRAADALGKVSKQAGAMRVQVVESFIQMIDGALGQIDRFVRGIKSGNWLDIIGGLLNAIDGIAAAFTGGSGFKIGDLSIGNRSGSTIPRWANGTDFHPGGLAIVGERGRELVNLPRGSQVHSNRELEAMGATGGSLQVRVIKGDMFDVIVERTAAGVVSQQAPGIVRTASSAAVAKIGRMQMKSLG